MSVGKANTCDHTLHVRDIIAVKCRQHPVGFLISQYHGNNYLIIFAESVQGCCCVSLEGWQLLIAGVVGVLGCAPPRSWRCHELGRAVATPPPEPSIALHHR
jgi:hypothetical protein